MKKSVIIIAIILMSIGFAVISTTLVINGNIKVSENEEDFSVIFTAASLDGNDVYNSVIDDTKKIITFETSNLSKIGDKSILTYEITNNSSNYDANVSVTCVSKTGTTKYTSIINKLENDTKKVASKRSVNGSLTITLNKTPIEEAIEEYTCKLDFTAIERDTLGKNIPEPVSFETDSWETIQKAVQKGNTSQYNVGDTKKIDLGTLGSHTIRISNMSECTTEISETACGFVIEFADIITRKMMNSTKTNVGGWKESELRAYLNNDLFLSFPSDLQDIIATTKVISSHGSTSGETNFETQDYLYLLSSEEVWGTNNSDTSIGTSKQLDYYKSLGVTESNSSNVIKQYNGNASSWWLRSAIISNQEGYFYVNTLGGYYDSYSTGQSGISPAFKIA